MMTSTEVRPLVLSQICLDGGTQPRSSIDEHVVQEYSERLCGDDQFPPLLVFFDGARYWLADGFHRYAAAVQAGLPEFPCEIRAGTLEDAQWASYAANAVHGLRRSNKDKQRAIQLALQHPLGAGQSNRQIAKHIGVDHSTVAEHRAKLESTGVIPQLTERKGADGKVRRLPDRGTTKAEDQAGSENTSSAAVTDDRSGPYALPTFPDGEMPTGISYTARGARNSAATIIPHPHSNRHLFVIVIRDGAQFCNMRGRPLDRLGWLLDYFGFVQQEPWTAHPTIPNLLDELLPSEAERRETERNTMAYLDQHGDFPSLDDADFWAGKSTPDGDSPNETTPGV